MSNIPMPTVHLNGTSQSELLDQFRAVYDALETVETAMRLASPHGRDYYVQEPGALAAAVASHTDRVSTIDNMRQEYFAAAVSIQAG